MQIIQLDLNNIKQVDDFLRLPFSIYRDIPQWVPPLQMNERLRFRPKRYRFYRHSQAAFFLASEVIRPVGRLAVSNRRCNEFNKTRADLRALVPHLKELYNDSLDGTTGTTPLTDEEVDSMANQIIWLADPKLVKMVMSRGKIVGFCLAYPDISAG